MAIAGLHNISVPGSSFLRGSQSQASRQRGDEGRHEDEHVDHRAPERVSDSGEMNSQQGGASSESREEQATEIGEHIERVCDGLDSNQNEARGEHIWRGIRRICGRQALVDMVKKAEVERQRELQGLLEHRAVTQFSHRNRIQSLLRGRFLRNDRLNENERPISMAASELGLLRERHAVSDLRQASKPRPASRGVWDPPAEGWLKCNTDNASKGIGGVLRDSRSNILVSSKDAGWVDAITTKLLVIKEALDISKATPFFGVSNLITESDSKKAISRLPNSIGTS